MARRFGTPIAWPPQLRPPRDGARSPMARRSSVVLPEPFGPISIVGAPSESVRVMRSRMVTAPTVTLTSWNSIGRLASGGCIASRRQIFAGAPRRPGESVDGNDDRHQHKAEPDGQRQIAFGGLQRDRGRHGAGEAVDIPADDDDGPDLRRGTAE